MGKVKAIVHKPNMVVVSIDLGKLAKKIAHGDSVAVNGTCLTATGKKGTVISFDAMKETLLATTLKTLKVGDDVNLELAMTPSTRLGGHFVTGHVDEVGVITAITKEPNWVVVTVKVSAKQSRYIVPKGSVTIDGVSLTVGKKRQHSFEVYLIPQTLIATTFGQKQPKALVNIETDVLAKYVLSR